MFAGRCDGNWEYWSSNSPYQMSPQFDDCLIIEMNKHTIFFFKFKWTNQLDATVSPVFYLTFIYSSTCFGRPHDHHQELNNCSSSLWFYLRSVVVAVLVVVIGPEMFHLVPASKQSAESVWNIPDAVCTVIDSWRWTERPSETCRVLLTYLLHGAESFLRS